MFDLTAEIAKTLLEYDPKTGKLFWRERSSEFFKCTEGRSSEHAAKIWNAKFSGKEAFTPLSVDGYKYGKIFARGYLAHRVIWLMQTGEWPKEHIDHINHDPADNRWQNLRAVTHAENVKNQSLRKNNTSGVTGVCWDRQRNKWSAKIQDSGSKKNLGHFDTLQEAANARKAAEKHYGFHENHGAGA